MSFMFGKPPSPTVPPPPTASAAPVQATKPAKKSIVPTFLPSEDKPTSLASGGGGLAGTKTLLGQ